MSLSPGHLAVEQEDLPRLRELLDCGYDVEDDRGDGWTLLRHAIDVEIDGHVQSGDPLHVDVTAFLLARGADPLRDANGIPPAEEAETRGHWLAAELIRAWTSRRAGA
ncbi:ankyrin repeat domain-containing protein [Streptomyces sp. So13.3]|uniref:ankyrin repeat domain-containing protein n=1 Tax=Streptomyces TaxID=1883 RepID=UPI0011061F40|nr:MULTISPECIES: ankyrin repeat domain-containing protein [Streptomyces]MCZ4102102.1 ankyrin repeat domain-containing protein [Streptomyces sp. H39-C1]QNA77509.1 ankyrin repeat domain-containing protein [Streptomyces sp. So13.3]